MVPCYLINLDRSPDRLAFISRRLQSLGIQYTRLAAVDGKLLPEAERASFIAARPRDGRSWRDGQIGCFMSHLSAWEEIAGGSDPFAVVIEDDVHVSDATPVFLRDTSWIPADADIVRLESTGQWLTLGKAEAKFANRLVQRVKSPAWATGGYIVSKAAASTLLAVEPRLHTPVDDFLFNLASSQVARMLKVYQVVPALVEQDKFIADQSASKGFGSDIETGAINQSLQGLSRLRRAITSTLLGKSRIEFR